MKGVFFPTMKFAAVFDVYCPAPVFIFGWIQKRTKKITAVMTRPDVGSGPQGHPPWRLR
jgi:hypothetical protein